MAGFPFQQPLLSARISTKREMGGISPLVWVWAKVWVAGVWFCTSLPGGAETHEWHPLQGPLGCGWNLRAPRRGQPWLLTGLCWDHLRVSPVQKAWVEQEEPGTPPSFPLSPEQLVHVQKNKTAALRRLTARNRPASFGESWKQHLGGESRKRYFITQMGFVA